ncbi:NACHT domain-containing protein [Streptomyces echinoruber]|uniref:NACHT domain-containing protein n=1 Tax=Streptomyces echinoruber TaxID=68898 RepID=UPI00167E1F32|nr:NACHT domain-containing protein [Streptomyces echinoruber]
MLFLLALVLGMGGALALAWYFKLGRATTAATLLPTLAPAYLAWKAFQHDRLEALPPVDLNTVADELAQVIKNQWDDEAAIRRLNDPYPLPIAWRAADADLVEPWALLTEVARAWPGGPPGDPAQWPTDATGLAGADGQIGEVFAQRVPTRRLVILGLPGSGKTMLLVRLLHDLIAQRKGGGPVPVLFSLASWDPAHQSLKDWLAEQLRRDHAGLRALTPPAAPGGAQVDLAQALLDSWLILPLLDGFDEIPPALHAIALDALNRALPAKQPLVVASRVAAYRDVLTQPDAMVRLNGAAGIHLLPLTADQAAAYLRHDAGGECTSAADRWNTVATHLGTDTPVGDALSTPLGLFLARTIYNPRPHTPATPGVIPHPNELCDTTAFPTRTALNAHLFNAYIPAAYALHHSRPPRWTIAQAHRSLVFLARHLETRRDGSPNLAWWELSYALPAHVRRLILGLAVVLVGGLVHGLAAGLVFGLMVALRSTPSGTPSTRLRWSLRSLRHLGRQLVAGFGFGLVMGLMFGLVFGLGPGITTGLAFGLTFGLKPTSSGGPSTRLRRSPRNLGGQLVAGLRFALAGGLAAGLGFGLVAGLAAGLGFGLAMGLAFALVFGLGFGLMVGLVVGLRSTSSGAVNARLRWSPRKLGGQLVVGLMTAVIFGLFVAGEAGRVAGLAFWLMVGLAVGLVVGLRSTSSGAANARLRWSPRKLGGQLVAGLVAGLAFGLAVGFLADLGLADGLLIGLTVGLVFGLIVGLVAGLRGEKPDLTTVTGPATLLAQDRRTFFAIGLLGGVVGGGFGLAAGLPGGLVVGLVLGWVGGGFGLLAGLVVGLEQTAWGGWVITKACLALRRRVPWNLMTFLQDAHEYRGVLRQVGAVYHFRHLDLQRHLAQQPWPPTT